MTYYWTGDRPLEALVLVPTRAGVKIDLTQFDAVEATLVTPAGAGVPVPAGVVEGAVQVDLVGDPFPAGGLYLLRIALLRTGTEEVPAGRERLDAVPLVVQDDDGWHTIPSARSEWRDAEGIQDPRLWRLLEISKGQVISYAPALPAGALPPINYREAQLMQARNLWNAARVDPSGSVGEGSFAVTPFPLDWTVKQLLRPKSARPVVA